MYARVHNITNVAGRKNYVKNKKDREEVVGFFDTASDGFWKLLAKENQEQFKRSTNANRANTKASEAREIVVGLPAYAADETTAQLLARHVNINLGVECMVAIHKKNVLDENGEKILNVHAHIIFAERTLLDEPVQVEEKRASRTYYYDAAGKKCKKADAVKVTPKGTITQEACTRYFSDKINFFNFKTIEPLLEDFEKQFKFKKFDIKKHFPQRKIGQNNPKEILIKEHNRLVREMNSFFDKLDAEGSERSSKAIFCEKFSVSQRFGVNRTDEVKEKFEAFKREFERSEEDLRAELQALLPVVSELEKDIEKAEAVLKPIAPSDFVEKQIAQIHRNALEEKYHCRVDKSFLAHLKEKLSELKQTIALLVEKLRRFAGHEEKNHGHSSVPKERSDRDKF